MGTVISLLLAVIDAALAGWGIWALTRRTR
jgi:hypothetical protein